MTKQYYEAHITMLGDPETVKPLVLEQRWKFSAIDGDINLGDGVKVYATRQFNIRIPKDEMVDMLLVAATNLERRGVTILRRKVEVVIFDDRSKLVKPCDGGCVECHLDDHPSVVSTAA